MFAPAYSQYSTMTAPAPAYYNPILDSVLSPAFLHDASHFNASYIPTNPQPTPNNEFASFSWSLASTSGAALVQHSLLPPTHRSAVLAPLETTPTHVYLRPSDARPPDSAVAIPRLPDWDWKAAILQWWPELADGDDATPATPRPQLSVAAIDELAQIAFVQQMLDGCDPQVDVETHPTVNSNPLNDEENASTQTKFDLPTGSGHLQCSGGSGAGHVTPRPQQGQSESETGSRSQEGNKKRKRNDSPDAEVELDRPFMPKRAYRPRKQREDIFVPYQPKRQAAPRSKGKGKMNPREDDEHDSRAREPVRLAPEW
ncbi:hypothetical protein HYPSUDRAFT_204704 [Hypholoma sublateritium FD-334 SS-4]|uniref:Uncharacterized protein n=1 Tax=Hypholoma sublateritium (strain FD-334 SS-4) TaxID=945553 RepID=A0A0D2PGT2_HYPSF|nr:hypothetical protein HYPSUDRAFT_204704 [Hypholoma sublateritium FD-334 SS-4]